jgi:DNA (cytosine-5)-methyltransferase 1
MAIQQETNGGLRELALFAGAGGGILGGKLLGWRTVCAVEWDAYAASVLVARQNDGCLPPFPIWDDVQTFDGRPWRGCVDVVSGGFPCQDISAAGKGAGIEGERSGMWKHMARIIGEVLPRFVLVENSPMLVGRGLGVVLADLAEMGYDAVWGIVGAHHTGAPHKRDRVWILAYSTQLFSNGGNDNSRVGLERETQSKLGNDCWTKDGADAKSETARRLSERAAPKVSKSGINGDVCNASGAGLPNGVNGEVGQSGEVEESERSDWWATEPDVGRVAHGVAARVDRMRCIGNGQVPAVAALAWRVLHLRA